eukprot:5636612-Pyramimonas_sp.AAC.1
MGVRMRVEERYFTAEAAIPRVGSLSIPHSPIPFGSGVKICMYMARARVLCTSPWACAWHFLITCKHCLALRCAV